MTWTNPTGAVAVALGGPTRVAKTVIGHGPARDVAPVVADMDVDFSPALTMVAGTAVVFHFSLRLPLTGNLSVSSVLSTV